MMGRKPRARDQPNQAYRRHLKNLKARDDEKLQETKKITDEAEQEKGRLIPEFQLLLWYVFTLVRKAQPLFVDHFLDRLTR